MLQYPVSQLHLLARCRKEFAINLGVDFCQILIRSLITINQEATTINRNDVYIFLRLKLRYDRSCDTNIRAAGFSRSCCRIVVIDVDVFCIWTIIIIAPVVRIAITQALMMSSSFTPLTFVNPVGDSTVP